MGGTYISELMAANARFLCCDEIVAEHQDGYILNSSSSSHLRLGCSLIAFFAIPAHYASSCQIALTMSKCQIQ